MLYLVKRIKKNGTLVKVFATALLLTLVLIPPVTYAEVAHQETLVNGANDTDAYRNKRRQYNRRTSLLMYMTCNKLFSRNIDLENSHPESKTKVYIFAKKAYHGTCRYDKWWAQRHLHKPPVSYHYSHFESAKGATYSDLPNGQSSSDFGVSWLQEPPIYTPYKKVRVSTAYWRHSERYFSLISSILALLSGLLINSVT